MKIYVLFYFCIIVILSVFDFSLSCYSISFVVSLLQRGIFRRFVITLYLYENY